MSTPGTRRRDASEHAKGGRRWRELAGWQRAGIVGLLAAETALKVAALVDIRRRPADRIRGTKRRWRLAMLLNPAELVYFAYGRKRANPTVR